MKKRIDFDLTCPTNLVPVDGNTHVTVSTNGHLIIRENHAYRKREPYQHVVDTDCAHLLLSPAGRTMTAKITLPFDRSSEGEFYRQMRRLFEKLDEEFGI